MSPEPAAAATGALEDAATAINVAAFEPLFEPWDEPRAHRNRNPVDGQPAIVVPQRRPSRMVIVQNLRADVRQWRDASYPGASDTTRTLLTHWFERPHRTRSPAGDEFEFRYYFCQREAVETLVYLKEVRRVECLSRLISEFGGDGPDVQVAALGVTEDEDAWARYAFKLATGAGKTKVMSLAIVWSYFHALRESESPMARHFVVIAPNLTVYERLKEDLGDGHIFDADPLIPVEWRGDWNMSVVLQDEAGGTSTGGALYLTNIHRLYDTARRRRPSGETYDFMGPAVSKSAALDSAAALRDRITAHRSVMIFNDEAHHVWDPDSAWNEAIAFLHGTIKARTGGGIVGQLDFTATPKDDKGQLFKHIVCDTPLGEAVDGGIVKTPLIGRAKGSLHEEASDDAAFRFDRHLRLGYSRWLKSRDEWTKSGKKALMFVMCEDTASADQITSRLNAEPTFAELNGRTINLHTNLKGSVKKVGRGASARMEFVESESQISDDDLRALRTLSRGLDSNETPYSCIVSVLMLREGWDVRNVTTIVPLRPYSATAAILPEQTLGRGLRRMTPPGRSGAAEIVTVVEHPAFAALYSEQLAQEGLAIEVVDADHVPASTVSIFPDAARKDLAALEIEIPFLGAAHRIVPKLTGLARSDVERAFARYKRLPLGQPMNAEIDYEGKHLFTGVVVERMKIHVPLLATGAGAVSYFVRQLEQICKIKGMHAAVAPLVQAFLEETLFEEKVSLFDTRLVGRLGSSDVAEHVRAVFVPLIRARTTSSEARAAATDAIHLSRWRPFQATHSERRPTLEAKRTLFNLVPCDRQLEVGFAKFADTATDVAAFAKNAGPQCLRLDYLGTAGNLAFYTPNFFVRMADRHCLLVETKGREDRDVPLKARAAIAWCEAASTPACRWEYLYVAQGVFERVRGASIRELVDTCRPALRNLVDSGEDAGQLTFATYRAAKDEEASDAPSFIPIETLDALPPRYRDTVIEATLLLRFFEKKPNMNQAPAFAGLLGCVDDAARSFVVRRLGSDVPADVPNQKAWFETYLPVGTAEGRLHHYQRMAQNLKRTLVFSTGISPLGLLRNCLDYALNDNQRVGGVFESVRNRFRFDGSRKLFELVHQVNEFRNTRIAHQEDQLTDPTLARREFRRWVELLRQLVASN